MTRELFGSWAWDVFPQGQHNGLGLLAKVSTNRPICLKT